MTPTADPVLVKRLSIFASAAALFSGLVGFSVLAGWMFRIFGLTTWGIAPVKMVANTAACFVLIGASLWLQRKSGSQPGTAARRLAAKGAAAVAGLVGLISLGEHLLGRDFGIDQLLVRVSAADHAAGVRPGLMSSLTAVDFLILGIALLLLDWRTRRGDWPVQFLCLGATMATLFGFSALILSSDTFPTTMAWPTAATLFVMELGLVCSRAEWALGGLLTGQSAGARLLRRAVPAALLVLGLIGWLISKPLLTDIHFTWVEVSALAVFCSTLLAGFIAWVAFQLERGEAERREVEKASTLKEEQLQRLLGRTEVPESEKQLRRQVTAGFGVAIFLTALLGFLSWHNSGQASEDADWVAHTQEVLTTLEATLRHLVDVETGARGFAMTGDELFLEPYEKGEGEVDQDLQALRRFTADNSGQQQRLDMLEKQVSARIKASWNLVAMRESTREVPGEAQLEPGKRVMDEARATIEAMETEEKLLLERRSERARAARQFSANVITLGSFLGVVFLALAGAAVNREVGISARARAQVNSLNAELEGRVAQRTAALGESEGRLAGVIQSAMDAIITTDEQQRILVFNKAAEAMFRCPAAEAVGQSIARFIPQRFHAAHAGHMKKFAENGATTRAMGPLGMLWGIRADGEEFQIEASISHIESGGRQLFTVILRDITERVRAEAQREHLAAVVDSSDDAIVSKDLRGIIDAWNRGAEKIFGYTAAEAIGQPMLMLFPPERRSEEAGILERIGRGESVEHFETVRVRKDGNKIDVSVTISPIRDSSGAVVGASKIARDITEHKRAQEALRQSDLRRGFALDTAQIGDWDLDPVTLQASRSALHDQIFGYATPLPEWNFDIFLRHIHPDDRERVRETFQSSLAVHKKWEFECRIVWPDGSIRWIWACGDQSRDASGKAIRMYGIVRDVTERKQTEEALREQARIMDSAQVFVRDMQSRVVYWPKGAEKLYGFTREEAVGALSHDLFHTQFPEPLESVEKKLFETGVWEGEMVHTRRDGSTIVVSSAWSLHRDSQGQPIRILETNIDITPRKQAEEALHESQEKLRLAVEGASLGTWNWDLKTGELAGSPLAFAMFGLSADTKFDFAIFLSMIRADDRAMVEEAMKRTLAQHLEYDVEYRCIWLDGAERWIAAKGRAYQDEAGENVRVGGIVFDVTERRRALEGLRESEERFQAMANGIPQLAWMAEADGNIFWYNQRWYEYTGTTFEQMRGWGWQSVHDPEVLPRVLEGWKRAIAAGGRFEMEFPLRRGDGEFGTFLTRVVPLRDAEGRVVRWFGTNTDISERKEAETRLATLAEELSASRQELEEKALMLQLVLDSMGEGLVAADQEGRFIIWNDSAKKLLGQGAADVPPEQWSAHYRCYLADGVTLHPVDRLPLVRALHGESVQVELIIRHKEQDEGIFLEFSARPMRDGQGNLCGGVVAFRDITQQKKDELEIRKLNEELEERVVQRTAELATANHELEAFAYSVSHDLRAPLRHIGGFSKILIEDFGPTMAPEAVRHLERIEEGTRRMGMLVDELLNLARVGRHALKLQSTPLNALIEEVISLLQPEVQGRVVTWKVAELPAAECDPILMKQVFQNLIANALKFTRPREQAVIEIGAQPENGQTAIFVRDNGVGFNMKYSDKLFGVFQRLHRIEDFEGTGVGLATVQRIVHKHGGRVWAEAELDKGAAFFFTLEAVKGARMKAEDVLRSDVKALNTKEAESKAAAAAGGGE